jgi:hypothetical protein
MKKLLVIDSHQVYVEGILKVVQSEPDLDAQLLQAVMLLLERFETLGLLYFHASVLSTPAVIRLLG